METLVLAAPRRLAHKMSRRECIGHLGRLWSLWEIMEKFEPGWLIQLSHNLTRIALSDEMRAQLRETNTLPVAFGELALACARLGLRVSNAQAHTMHTLLKSNPDVDIKPRLKTFIETIETEMRAQCFLELSPNKIDYFLQHNHLFSENFAKKFPSAAYDLDETGKCLAFERSTAAVFHLMRLMEIGLRATARCLGIPDPIKAHERNWHDILERKIRPQVDAKWPSSTRLSGDGVLFEDIYASLSAVKNAWRNATMHVERIYTEEEAMHIFHAVKGFMSKVAARMDENGKPVA
jgi:hypothetical protein